MNARLDGSHDPALRSWVESANLPDTDFPIQNLPFGVFARRGMRQLPGIGVAIGDQVLDLPLAAKNLRNLPVEVRAALSLPALNALMALGHDAMRVLRGALVELLRDGSASADPDLLVPMAAAEMHVPAAIGDYTDFFASIHHATRVGRLFRPDHPLSPNYTYVPIAYHGRSSSIVPSGTAIRRPSGQTKSPDETWPSYRPSRALDYELEAGIFIGRGSEFGRPVDIADADHHVFGLCLLNDWSARDIQAWESQPLGPFLAKNFATTISPWIVTLEALAPFRCEPGSRAAGDPEPLPHLTHRAGTAPHVDMHVEVWMTSERMRNTGAAPMRLGRSSTRDLYWDIGQMVTHHASNGCNLRPGDLLGTGTISGAGDESHGCLLEITANGRQPIELPNGERQSFLADGDEVALRGYCEREGFARIGFGECRGIVVGMNTTRLLLLALLCSVGLASGAAGQARVELGGAAGASFQTEGESDSPYLGPGFGGTTPAVIVFVDGLLAPGVTLGGELSLARHISGEQSQRAPGGNNHFVSEHRDEVMSATVKFNTPREAAVRTAVVGGAGIARRHTHRIGQLFRSVPPFEAPPFEETVTSVVPAFTGGVDTVVRLGRHVGVVIAARLHYLLDDDRQDDGVVERGVSSVMFRFGAGLQVGF